MNALNLLEIISVGKNIINDIESTDDRYKSLLVLIHLESVLDKGRTILNSSDLDKLPEINKGVDEIRLKIVELMKSLDKKEIQKYAIF